jgi:hypothetical protein
VLVPGAVTLLAGKPKIGKSTLAHALAEGAASGAGAFLGRTLRSGPVLYASEESISTLAGSFPRRENIYLLSRDWAWPKPRWVDLLAATAEAARNTGAVLAVVDSFAFWNGLTGDGEQSAGYVQPLLDGLAVLTAAGCAVLLVHHHRKSGGEAGDAVRGSSAIAGAVDAFAELERIENAPPGERGLVVTSRWPSPPVLVFDRDEPGAWRVIGQAEDRKGSGQPGWRDRLLAALSESRGTTLDELADVLGADRRKWHGALSALIDDKLVQRTGTGARNDPYRHRLVSVPEPGTERDGNEGCRFRPDLKGRTETENGSDDGSRSRPTVGTGEPEDGGRGSALTEAQR